MEDRLVPYQAVDCIAATSVLVLAPHPDDEIFGCGGTLVAHARAGHHIRVIVLTDGAYGLQGQAKTQHTAVRQNESRAAAALLGIAAPQFWELPDRGLVAGSALTQRLVQAINESQADLVYATSPREMHPDHWHLALAALDAIKQCARPALRLASYEVGIPLAPNVLCDITPRNALKLAAMQCCVSQLQQQRYEEHIQALNRYRSFTLGVDVTHAEAFYVADSMALAKGTADPYETPDQRSHRLGMLYHRSAG